MNTNGCGGEGSFKFRVILDWIRWCALFDYKQAEHLYNTIEKKCCNPHDKCFSKGGGIIKFIKCNYIFSLSLTNILHWSNVPSRIFIFIISIIGLSTFGIKYFNWKYLIFK